ncbi:MAG: hypothetical protein MUP21_04430 [Dehalococcoidia bacterium]|nr:hypothetical protein [Dehalococcoidia bacterium]
MVKAGKYEQEEGKLTGSRSGDTERALLLIIFLVIVLTVGWSIKPVREYIWGWIRKNFSDGSRTSDTHE